MGCLHDNGFTEPPRCLGLPLGNQLCAAGLSVPPLPTPTPNSLASCLFSASILFWLNGHKHKLSISSKSVELGLADENNLGEGVVQKHEARAMATRAEEVHVEGQISATAPRRTHCINKTRLSLLPPLPPKKRKKLSLDLYLLFRRETRQPFIFFPNSLNTMSSKGKHWFANTSTPGTAVHPTLPFNMKSAGCAVRPT